MTRAFFLNFISFNKQVSIATLKVLSAAGGKGFKPLADYLHAKRLKFGIHIMSGIPVVAVKRNLPIKGTPITARGIYTEKDQCRWLKICIQ